ncbi:MAG: mechanosensitive ion channel [Blastocatellia bacterium]|nr:mechanosensitive ion channel [Blastocatellia bacterium]
MWPEALRTGDWYVNIPATALAFIALALLVLRLRREQRAHVLRVTAFFAVSILAAFVDGISEALGYSRVAVYAREVAVVIAGISIIIISGSVIFRIILPTFRLMPPRILQDVLIAISLIIFGLVRLGNKGIDPANIFTTSALITAVIALSLQDTLGNILGGLALQLDRSVQVGDWVHIDDVEGQVVEIGWRQTSIETNNWGNDRRAEQRAGQTPVPRARPSHRSATSAPPVDSLLRGFGTRPRRRDRSRPVVTAVHGPAGRFENAAAAVFPAAARRESRAIRRQLLADRSHADESDRFVDSRPGVPRAQAHRHSNCGAGPQRLPDGGHERAAGDAQGAGARAADDGAEGGRPVPRILGG